MTRSLVVGAGSIGTRHAEVLAGLGHEVAVVSSRSEVPGVRFDDVVTAVERFEPQYAVVATETGRHAASVSELSAAGFTGLLLVEKPLATPGAELAAFSRVGVGFNLRFHPVLQRLRGVLEAVPIQTVEAYVGQHLSTWRPGRESSYSQSRQRGGGALRDLSHELDYLAWLLGPCEGLFALGGRLHTVTDDADDAWGLVARHERAPLLTLQLNYLDTHTRRRFVANTSIGTVEADLVAGSLRIADAVEQFDVDRNTTYRAMHEAMLADGSDVASVDEATAVDATIEMVERSAATNSWVERP